MKATNSKRLFILRVGIWVTAALVISVATAVGAGRIPGAVLGTGLAIALVALGVPLLLYRPSKASNDISNLKRELNRTRRGYERLFTSVPCFICVLDRDHQITEANELYRKEFGATDRSRCYEVCKARTSSSERPGAFSTTCCGGR